MKKPNIKKLKYPIWFNIIFYVLTIVIPVVLIMVEGYKSPNGAFRVTFGIITGLVILWTFIYKFIISGKEKDLHSKKLQLEHEYEIEVGKQENIKWLWFTNEKTLAIINAIQVLLIGSLILLLCVGVNQGFMAVKAMTLIVAISYVCAYILKFAVIAILRGTEKEDLDEETGDGEQ